MAFMHSLTESVQQIVLLLQTNWSFLLTALAILWIIQFFNFLVGYRLNILGLYPRTLHGLLGIFFAPWLHGSFNHLFFNSIPLIVLANLILLEGKTAFYRISLLIIVISGGLTWLLGRRGFHVGASALIMGYFGFLLANAYHEGTAVTVLACVIGLYYFSSLLLNLIPTEVGVSWEGHVFGFLAGIVTAIEKPLIVHYLGS